MSCKWYNLCPLRRFEREKKISDYWRNHYCLTETGWKDCKRYQLEEISQPHPDTILPNGANLNKM
jgi:hypothetical protein